MLIITTINGIIDFLATIIFTLAGCMMVEKKPLRIAVFPGILCAFGGGFTRDILLWSLVSRDATPVVFTAYVNWVATIIGLIIFAWLKLHNATNWLRIGKLLEIRMLIDYVGVGEFLAAGVIRTRKLGIDNPIILTLFGSLTALGGGLISLAAFKEQKRKTLKENIIYYLTAFFTSCVIVNIMGVLDKECIISFLASIICAFVRLSVVSARFSIEQMVWNITIYSALIQKTRKVLRRGAYYRMVRNPMKGIHLRIQTSRKVGNRTEYMLLDATT